SGDIITQIDDFKVINWHDMDPAIDNRNVGDAIQVTFYRNGDLMTANRPIKSRAATHNDHSRPEGPVVIEPEEPSSEISEAILEDALEEEILALELALQPQETTEAGGASINDESENVRSFEQIEGAQLSFEELKVFPNPSTGIFDVQFDLPEEGRTAIRIYNPKGQAIYFNNLGNFSGVFSDRIDIANSMKGTYFLELSQDDKRLVRKLILQ
ncbi:MAG: T9SS type A sorting domain-containing protein, partial [Saprospiraceae bacterium]|nr:T9SS type A sorting domain-containing protein [Saprospiraceae bacterium]